jgi:hypothetical protein
MMFYLGPALVMDADILFPRQRALLSGWSPADNFSNLFLSTLDFFSCTIVYMRSLSQVVTIHVSSPSPFKKGLSHGMELAFDDMHGQF